jgi:hypothetical protein
MPIFKSAYFDPIIADPKWLQDVGGAAVNAVLTIVIPAFPASAPHILLVVAGFSDGVTSQVASITQAGWPFSPFNFTVKGNSGVNVTVLRELLPNTPVTLSLPASGVGGVIGYMYALYRIS